MLSPHTLQRDLECSRAYSCGKKNAGLVTEPRPLYIANIPTYDLTHASRQADRENTAHDHTKGDTNAQPGYQKRKTPG